MKEMTASEDTSNGEQKRMFKTKLRTPEERERRWAEIRAGNYGAELESSPEWQEMRRSQEEFRKRIKAITRRLGGS